MYISEAFAHAITNPHLTAVRAPSDVFTYLSEAYAHGHPGPIPQQQLHCAEEEKSQHLVWGTRKVVGEGEAQGEAAVAALC